MNQTIINTYGIFFTTKRIDFSGNGGEIVKIFKSNQESMDEFFNSLDNPQNLLDYLMPDIDAAMSNPGSEFENGSETINITIDSNKVDFFNAEYDILFTLPTIDFKEIVEGWISFLHGYPAQGSPAISPFV